MDRDEPIKPKYTVCSNCDAVAAGHLEYGHCGMPAEWVVGDPFKDKKIVGYSKAERGRE